MNGLRGDDDHPPERGDEFEAGHMRDGSPVRHRDKRVSRGMVALLGLSGLFSFALAAVVALAGETPPDATQPFAAALLAGVGLLLVTCAVAFAVVRTVVTEREVHIKYGLWGPRIPLPHVRSCRVVDYQWVEYGGWGIRLGRDGSMAYVPGGKRVVEICYDDGAAANRVLVGAENPDEVVRQIELAREAARRARGRRGRVAGPERPAALAAAGDPDGEEDAGAEGRRFGAR